MIDLMPLVKSTGAYEVISKDKAKGRLSHAYLIVCSDEKFLEDYLKILARLITCEKSYPCGECRACRMIEGKVHPDVEFYPKDKQMVVVEDIKALIDSSFVKPIESDKKLLVITRGQDMNVQSQNKLLKTLEEPPANVHIIIGTTTEYAILPTVKSRAKKLTIPEFDGEMIFSALSSDCPDEERLKKAIICGDGTVGKALALYNDQSLKNTIDLVCDILVNMRSSSAVLEFSDKIAKSKVEIGQFLSVTESLLRDLLMVKLGQKIDSTREEQIRQIKDAQGFTPGAIIYALDKIVEAKKRKRFNANPTMLIEWLLFSILEGKFKWQKS